MKLPPVKDVAITVARRPSGARVTLWKFPPSVAERLATEVYRRFPSEVAVEIKLETNVPLADPRCAKRYEGRIDIYAPQLAPETDLRGTEVLLHCVARAITRACRLSDAAKVTVYRDFQRLKTDHVSLWETTFRGSLLTEEDFLSAFLPVDAGVDRDAALAVNALASSADSARRTKGERAIERLSLARTQAARASLTLLEAEDRLGADAFASLRKSIDAIRTV